MLIGYARVSTRDQNLDLQIEALTKAECQKIFDDKISGSRAERPGLTQALEMLREGDTLVVWKLDRLGRSVTPSRFGWRTAQERRPVQKPH
jgi:DNA invertase Pin-like site-specific DNA recombinase